MLDFKVDAGRCTRCGRCTMDCPVRIIARGDDGLPRIIEEEAEDCMHCQHCLAICPTGAVSILGRDPADSDALTGDALPTLEDMCRLVRGRRSVRMYADDDVAPALIETLVSAMANAPTGVNRMELSITVIDRRETLAALRAKAMALLELKEKRGELPEENRFLTRIIEAYRDEDRDLVFRGAPHALIVSAPPDAPCPQQDIALALAYFELLAQTAGLGTCWCGLMSMLLENLPELKDDIGLPPDHPHYEMLFGTPMLRYARTVQRNDGAAIRTLEL